MTASVAATASPAASDIATVEASATTAATAPVTRTPSPAPAATPGPVPAKPPTATLRGLAGEVAARGQLGSYTWGSAGSDAPWIVGKVLATVTPGSTLDVPLGGAVPAGWTAAWAAVSDGTAGSPSGGVSGVGNVAVTAPATAGDWSLRVTATFGPGHNATYFWHLRIAN